MSQARIMLTAGASGSGKTLITCGLLQALVNRNLTVASFKCGPDYIDPMFHSKVIGTASHNLDTFFTGKEMTRWLFLKNSEEVDLSVMEGVMGYYDGVAGTTTQASAYDLACTTDTPVILIVNAKGMSVSLAAYIKGFLEYRPDSRIKGVIFNQMSPMLYPRMKALVEQELGIHVYGYVPKVDDCLIESRHLGLMLPGEIEGLKERLQKLSHVLEQTLEIDHILALARSANPLAAEQSPEELDPVYGFHTSLPVRIGVASDEAFCFFYEDNFRLLRQMGAELVPFSPIHDEQIPENVDGLLFYGGYPELFAEKLSQNSSMRNSVKNALAQGMPCLAECGGFMYLHEKMQDMDHRFWKMAGALPGQVVRTPRLKRFGYITLTQNPGSTPAFCQQTLGEIRAHEFHYFDSDHCGSSFHAAKPQSARGWDCICTSDTLLAGYPHFYYYAQPRVPAAFLTACEKYKTKERL